MKSLTRIIICYVVAYALTGCSSINKKKSKVATGGPGTYEYYRKKINDLSDYSDPGQAKGIISKGAPQIDEIKNGNSFYKRTTTHQALEANLSDLVLFGGSSNVIFPGALIRSNALNTGNMSLINIAREPVDIWVNISHSPNISAKKVDADEIGVNQAINKILSENTTGYKSALDFNFSSMYSLDQSLLQLGLSADWLSGSVAASLASKKNIENNIMLVKFTQNYYSANFQLPKDGNEYIFSKGMTNDKFDYIMDTKNPPLYISSVSYGRMLLFKIESKSSMSEMEQALKLSNDFIGGKITAEMAQASLQKLRESEITVISYGGGAKTGAEVISSKDFYKFISQDNTPSASSPGAPISFIVKELKGNNLIKYVKTTEFDKSIVESITKNVRFTIHNMKIWDDGDSGLEGQGDFTWLMKVNGQIISEATSEVVLGTGADHKIDKSIQFKLPYSSVEKIVFEAEIIERDGWTSGSDDYLPPINVTFYIDDLVKRGKITESRRPGKGSDPDIELWFTAEIVD